jgi:Ran GTPase-activating protein (RanGAP) involved in mRNA processing and transport
VSLNLGAGLNDKGTQLIADMLKFNSALKELDLDGNCLKCEGAQAMSEMLKMNSTLEEICLRWNGIGFHGF